MDCRNSKISELLPDYFSGHLNDVDISIVEEHLPECQFCQENLRVMELLANNNELKDQVASSAHIAPELLTRYYVSKDSLENSAVSEIETHLDSCHKCTLELDFMTGLESDLLATDKSRETSQSLMDDILRAILEIFRKPALAYLLVAIVFFPTMYWLINEDNSVSKLQSETVFVLSEQIRSEGEIPLVTRTIEDRVIRLQVSYFHLSAEKRYEFIFTNQNSDSSLAIEVISDLNEKGSIQLLANLEPLSDGSYILNILEIDKGDDKNQSQTLYPFRLETTK